MVAEFRLEGGLPVLALRGRTASRREAAGHAAPAKHGLRHPTVCSPASAHGSPGAAAVASLPSPRTHRSTGDLGTRTRCRASDDRYEVSSGPDCRPPLRSMPDRRAAAFDRGAVRSSQSLPHRGEPRLRRARRAVESRAISASTLTRDAPPRWSLPPRTGTRCVRSTPDQSVRRRTSGAAACCWPNAGDARATALRRTGARRRSVRHHARRPRRGRRARPRRRRRGPHRHRRLPLVHRLGPRHDDQPGRADPGHRPARRGRLHPAHLRPLRSRRPDPQPVPGGRDGGALPHRRRDPVVLPCRRPLPGLTGDRETLRVLLPKLLDIVDHHLRGHPLRHRRRSRRRPACARGRRAISSPGWTPRWATGW